MDDLRITRMGVIWRDTFMVDGAPRPFFEHARQRLQDLSCVRATSDDPHYHQPVLLNLSDRVWMNITRQGTSDILRASLEDIRIASLSPTLRRLRARPADLSVAQCRDAALRATAHGAWIRVKPLLVLHRAGAAMMQYHIIFDLPYGARAREVINLVRMGISPQLLDLTPGWRQALPPAPISWDGMPHPVDPGDGTHVAAAGLRDLSQWVVAKALCLGDHPPRPTGTSTVILSEVDPAPTDNFDHYLAHHAATLRGIGAMDRHYEERAQWLVEQEMFKNLSTDSELAVFLLGKSDLFLFNDRLPDILDALARRSYIGDETTALTYMLLHYSVLVDWVTLQKALLTTYLDRIDRLTQQARPDRGRLVAVLQDSINDLEQYQDSLSPYANRTDFVDAVSAHNGLDRLMERFERKQELLLAYAQEYHDFQEVRAAVFLNWLAGILAAAEFSSIVLPVLGVTQDEEPVLYALLALGSIGVVFVVLAWLRRERRVGR